MGEPVAPQDGAQATVEMVAVNLGLPPHGRPAVIHLPKDITEQEAYHLLTAVAEVVVRTRAANPASRLILPAPPGPFGRA